MAVDVFFVASNDTHVTMFDPVMALLRGRGVEVLLGGLDTVYGQGTSGRAAALGLDIEQLCPYLNVNPPFYRRSTLAIWRDVLRARTSMTAWLEARSPRVVVLGNDFGLVEKALVDVAHRHDCRVALVQDGALWPPLAPATSAGPVIRAGARRLGSSVLQWLGLPYLASSRYGAGGADLICATGDQAASLLRTAGAAEDRVRVTGQPRFDTYRSPRPSAGITGLVVAFTEPYKHAGYGNASQDRQSAMLRGLQAELKSRGVELYAKPHPREDPRAYAELLGDPLHVITRPAPIVLGEAAVAIVGPSTIVDEAALAGVPVVVPGVTLHSPSFEGHLPPKPAYPRFDTVADGARLVLSLLGDQAAYAATLRAQQAVAVQRTFVDRHRSAAECVADEITDLLVTCAS